MNNLPQRADSVHQELMQPGPSVHMNGANSVFIEQNNGTIYNNYNVVSYTSDYIPPLVDTEYYSLMVFHKDAIGRKAFEIDRRSCLTRYTAKEALVKFDGRTDAHIAAIKSLPCLVCEENVSEGSPDVRETHLGFIMGITLGNFHKFDMHLTARIPLNKVMELKQQLHIAANENRSEFDVCHWAIKKVNLLELLLSAALIHKRFKLFL